ncbi:hypothetical protein HII31_01215 [Pseudocercospora fuligena]|uniref:NmrA-like domain-containing protein n=1 Tax=Pseudocercospora fuligena TaxID=685502 RepID=A0A8H6VSQ0_9PEZI|nr:hypothetical protein HII31_01215 [Pseudocercospora fuligena]
MVRLHFPKHFDFLNMPFSNGLDGGRNASIQKVLIIGDNRKAASISKSLPAEEGITEIYHAVHRQSTLKPSGNIRIHPTDFSADSLRSVFSYVKPGVIFSTSSGGSYDFQRQLIDLAIEFRVPRFVAAEYEQDSLNSKIQARLPPCRERARVIEYLQQRSSQNQIEWAAVATGCALDQGLISGNLGFDIKWQSVTVHGTGQERFAASSTAWIGQVTVAILNNWEAIKNQYFYASGTITSANEILNALQIQTGQNWERGEVEVEEAMREAERRMDRGFPDAAMFLMEKSVLCDESLDALKPFIEQDCKEKLGLQTESLDELVMHAVHEFQHHGKGGCGCD